MALHTEIQEVIDRDTGRHGLANNHLKGVIELLERNSDVITPEVFNTLMASTAEALNLEHADRIKDLKTVLKLRELVSGYLANTNNGNEPVVTKQETATTLDLGDPLPTATSQEDVVTAPSFDLGDPLEEPETEEEPQLVTTRLATANKSAVLTKFKPETEQAAPVETEETSVDTSTLIEIPNTTEAVSEPTTEVILQPSELVTVTEAPVKKRRGRQPGTKISKAPSTPKVISDVDLVVTQLVDHIQSLQNEVETLRAENEKLKQEAHTSKVSAMTRKKLEALGINL